MGALQSHHNKNTPSLLPNSTEPAMSRAIVVCIALFSALAQAFSRNVERGYKPLRSIRRNHMSPSMMDHNSIVTVTTLRGGAIKQEVSSKVQQAGGLLFLTSLLNGYTGLLSSHPYITKIVSSAVVGGLGDVLIQSYDGRKSKKPIDLRRLLVFSMVTGIYIAPVIHLWFNFLAGMPFLAKMSNMKQALWMMFVDQTVGATIITMGFFIAFEMVRRNNECFTRVRLVTTTLVTFLNSYSSSSFSSLSILFLTSYRIHHTGTIHHS